MGVAKLFIDNIWINVYGLLTNVGKVNFFFYSNNKPKPKDQALTSDEGKCHAVFVLAKTTLRPRFHTSGKSKMIGDFAVSRSFQTLPT